MSYIPHVHFSRKTIYAGEPLWWVCLGGAVVGLVVIPSVFFGLGKIRYSNILQNSETVDELREETEEKMLDILNSNDAEYKLADFSDCTFLSAETLKELNNYYVTLSVIGKYKDSDELAYVNVKTKTENDSLYEFIKSTSEEDGVTYDEADDLTYWDILWTNVSIKNAEQLYTSLNETLTASNEIEEFDIYNVGNQEALNKLNEKIKVPMEDCDDYTNYLFKIDNISLDNENSTAKMTFKSCVGRIESEEGSLDKVNSKAWDPKIVQNEITLNLTQKQLEAAQSDLGMLFHYYITDQTDIIDSTATTLSESNFAISGEHKSIQDIGIEK